MDDDRGARRGGAAPARRTPGERQHLPAPSGAGEDGRDGRPGQRRPRRARPGRGVAGERASRLRPRVLDRGRAPGAARGGLPGDQGSVHAAAHHLPGQVLPAHRRAARAQAGAAAAAAPGRRRRREGDPAHRGQVRRRMERVGRPRHAAPQDGGPRSPLRVARSRSQVDQAVGAVAALPERRRRVSSPRSRVGPASSR